MDKHFHVVAHAPVLPSGQFGLLLTWQRRGKRTTRAGVMKGQTGDIKGQTHKNKRADRQHQGTNREHEGTHRQRTSTDGQRTSSTCPKWRMCLECRLQPMTAQALLQRRPPRRADHSTTAQLLSASLFCAVRTALLNCSIAVSCLHGCCAGQMGRMVAHAWKPSRQHGVILRLAVRLTAGCRLLI